MKVLKLLKNKKRIYKILFSFLLLLPFFCFFYDSANIKKGEKSKFTIPTIGIKDGGSKYRIGIGYGVYEWKKMTIEKVNGKDISGYMVGSEIISFPDCYRINKILCYEPSVELKFISWNEAKY